MAQLGWRLGAFVGLFWLVAVPGPTSAQDDGPTPVPPSLKPAITEIEVDWVNDRLRLRAEVVPRGAKVAKVFFTYRGKRVRAAKTGRWKYARTVKPRGGDARGDRVRFKVRACTATVCTARSDGDKADRPSGGRRR